VRLLWKRVTLVIWRKAATAAADRKRDSSLFFQSTFSCNFFSTFIHCFYHERETREEYYLTNTSSYSWDPLVGVSGMTIYLCCLSFSTEVVYMLWSWDDDLCLFQGFSPLFVGVVHFLLSRGNLFAKCLALNFLFQFSMLVFLSREGIVRNCCFCSQLIVYSKDTGIWKNVSCLTVGHSGFGLSYFLSRSRHLSSVPSWTWVEWMTLSGMSSKEGMISKQEEEEEKYLSMS
jgi:hypothetical protein